MNAQTSTRLVGYARVSTTDQDLELQLDALRNAGVGKQDIFTDQTRAPSRSGGVWTPASGTLKSGDTLLVRRLDRPTLSSYVARG